MVKIKIKPKLKFGDLVTADGIEIAPRGRSQIRVEFDTTRWEPGDYKGELVFDCVNCSPSDKCFDLRKHVPVFVQVR
jgi:hypothetical protein